MSPNLKGIVDCVSEDGLLWVVNHPPIFRFTYLLHKVFWITRVTGSIKVFLSPITLEILLPTIEKTFLHDVISRGWTDSILPVGHEEREQ